jgi:hypothetical protein
MSSVWGIILIVLLLIIWIIAGGYITQANVYLSPLKNTDNLFQQAYNYTFWAAFITWTLVGIFILIIILAIFGVVALFGSGAGEAEVAAGEVKEEESIYSKVYKQYQKNQSSQSSQPEESGMSWLTIVFLFIAAILLSITGILAAISAEDMTKSHSFDENNNNIAVAYNDCIIAAILSLTSVGLLVLAVIAYLFIGFFSERHKNTAVVPTITPVAATVPAIVPVTTSNIPTVTPVTPITRSNVPKITPLATTIPTVTQNSYTVSS